MIIQENVFFLLTKFRKMFSTRKILERIEKKKNSFQERGKTQVSHQLSSLQVYKLHAIFLRMNESMTKKIDDYRKSKDY